MRFKPGGIALSGAAEAIYLADLVPADRGAALGRAGAVLNRPLEIDAASGGLRPKFAGAIDTSGYMVCGLFAFMMLSGRVAQPLVSFQDVTFTYGGTKIPALSGVNFSIPTLSAAGRLEGMTPRFPSFSWTNAASASLRPAISQGWLSPSSTARRGTATGSI